jgi:hypothetical protein
MTSSATMPYPCSFVSIRGEIALLEKNKKVKISKQSEPNIGKLPGPPHNRSLGEKSAFAIGTQEVIENNTERSPGNPTTQHRPPSRTMAFSPQSADPPSGKWSALCLIR